MTAQPSSKSTEEVSIEEPLDTETIAALRESIEEVESDGKLYTLDEVEANVRAAVLAALKQRNVSVDEEIHNAELAVEDIIAHGITNRRCLVCGSKLEIRVSFPIPSSCSVTCKSENRLIFSSRGL